MAANSLPICSKIGKITAVAVTAANASSQGGGTIGTDIFLCHTSDATNGSYIREIRCTPTATTPTTTTATVARVFLSTQASGATTSSNTHLLAEIALPALSADSATVANPTFSVPINMALNASQTILITNNAAPAANTSWKFIVVGGDY